MHTLLFIIYFHTTRIIILQYAYELLLQQQQSSMHSMYQSMYQLVDSTLEYSSYQSMHTLLLLLEYELVCILCIEYEYTYELVLQQYAHTVPQVLLLRVQLTSTHFLINRIREVELTESNNIMYAYSTVNFTLHVCTNYRSSSWTNQDTLATTRVEQQQQIDEGSNIKDQEMMIKRFISKFMTQRHPKLIDPQCGKPHRPTP